ncbi:hypothetical protein Q4494_15065 [Celeribacter halophilus]|uniref:Uncharacterized protein n=1 Tax=Celeribacter halophilus TaxID=576117 RepID=A0AAW7Y030_9RHOB|nr:hypothetical protein [Celeribacter halophilus]MDO6458409.1 hypothetical protein [Celeribacter halophilus]
MVFPHLRPNDADTLRDAALLLERDHFELAHKLMVMAQRARPNGPFINRKLEEYHGAEGGRGKIQELINSGALAVIPAGFRCSTKMKLASDLGLKQASLPFDSGFFPPSSILRLFETRQVALKFPDPNAATHQICTKDEGVYRGNKRGINFRTSSYEKINSLVESRTQKNINNLLDATFGYYTLDKINGFVLAHYNWHKFASEEKSKGMRAPALNIPNINRILNSRIKRMFDMCDRAQKVLFVVDRDPSCEFMAIDDHVYDLTNIEPICDAVSQKFGARAIVVHFHEINTEKKLLHRIS